MKHIKTPVEFDGIAIFDATGRWLCELPSEHCVCQGSGQEIVQAVNEHDDLLAQRDALVAACEAFIDVLDKSPGNLKLLQFVARLASTEKKARAALALVGGTSE